jgi:hypothetical protein
MSAAVRASLTEQNAELGTSGDLNSELANQNEALGGERILSSGDGLRTILGLAGSGERLDA